MAKLKLDKEEIKQLTPLVTAALKAQEAAEDAEFAFKHAEIDRVRAETEYRRVLEKMRRKRLLAATAPFDASAMEFSLPDPQ